MLRDLAKRVVRRLFGHADVPQPWDTTRWKRYFEKRQFFDQFFDKFNNHYHYNPLAPDQEVCWPLPPKTPLLQFVEGVFEEDLPKIQPANDPLYLKLFAYFAQEVKFTREDILRLSGT